MAVCPVCQAEFDSVLPGRLCDRCAAAAIAQDVYQPSDLRFVGVLAGVLGAAVLSMPGSFFGYYLGRIFDRASTGCLIGLIVMSLAGLAAGYVIGPRICLRMERARQQGMPPRTGVNP